MPRSATEVMHDILVAAAIESIMSLKTASRGLPNALLRDINAIHANTSFDDLPKELQATIASAVRTAFTQLHREGYSVSSSQAPPPRPQGRHDGRPPPRGPRPDGGRPNRTDSKPVRRGGRPPKGNKPTPR